MNFQKRTILITGGSSGLGLEMAKQFSALGSQVLICGRSQDKLDRAQAMLPGIFTCQADISKNEERERLVDWVKVNHPNCSVLINNAALAHAFQFGDDADAMAKANLEIETNLTAPIHLSKLMKPLLAKQPTSSLINITTGLAYVPRDIYPFYNATKAGLHSFTQVLRRQLNEESITVTEVMFPAVDTPWHHGKAPKIAITAQEAVTEMVSGLKKGRETIRVGKVKLLYWISRIAPGFALKKVNAIR